MIRRVLKALRTELYVDVPRTAAIVASSALPHTSFNRARTAFLRAAGVRIGPKALVMGTLRVTGPSPLSHLTIGRDTMITGPLMVDLGAHVDIGQRVHIGPEVMLLTLTHEMRGPEERCGPMVAEPITIGDGVWLCSRVTVLPGVTIGKGSCIAAGSVVVKDIPANVMAAGNPARIMRSMA